MRLPMYMRFYGGNTRTYQGPWTTLLAVRSSMSGLWETGTYTKSKYPHLRPQWAQQQQQAVQQQGTSQSFTQPLYQPAPVRLAQHQAHFTQDETQNQEYTGSLDNYSFAGPETQGGSNIAHAFLTLHEQLGNRTHFDNEYCFTLRDQPCLLSRRVTHMMSLGNGWLTVGPAVTTAHSNTFFLA